MIWNQHKDYEGKHAFLGASQFRWINWDDTTLEDRYFAQYSQVIATVVHELAHDCIYSHTKLNKSDKHIIDIFMFKNYIPKGAYDSEFILSNIIPFVNDAIGFHMKSEVLLFYSNNCFGTTDAISVDEKEKIVRIFDLKTGTTPAHIEQLLIYAALFYLEYSKTINLKEYKTILRLYQNGEIMEFIPENTEIEKYMEIIRRTDNKLQLIKGVTI